MMEKLKDLLAKVPRTYENFQMLVLYESANDEAIQKQLIDFILDNPEAGTGSILSYLHKDIMHKEPMEIIFVDDDELDDDE